MNAGFVFSEPKNPQFLYEKIFLGGTAIGKAECLFLSRMPKIFKKVKTTQTYVINDNESNFPWILASLFPILL